MTIANQIALLRKERGWSQAELARKAGLSPSTIAMYETNRRTPDEDMVRKLAQGLDVTVRRLTGEAPAQQMPAATPGDNGGTQSGDAGHRSQADQRSEAANAFVLEDATQKNDAPVTRSTPGVAGELNLQVSVEEARVLLAMRMSPAIHAFLLSYVNASEEERERLEKTWHVIRSFQKVTHG